MDIRELETLDESLEYLNEGKPYGYISTLADITKIKNSTPKNAKEADAKAYVDANYDKLIKLTKMIGPNRKEVNDTSIRLAVSILGSLVFSIGMTASIVPTIPIYAFIITICQLIASHGCTSCIVEMKNIQRKLKQMRQNPDNDDETNEKLDKAIKAIDRL